MTFGRQSRKSVKSDFWTQKLHFRSWGPQKTSRNHWLQAHRRALARQVAFGTRKSKKGFHTPRGRFEKSLGTRSHHTIRAGRGPAEPYPVSSGTGLGPAEPYTVTCGAGRGADEPYPVGRDRIGQPCPILSRPQNCVKFCRIPWNFNFSPPGHEPLPVGAQNH